MSVWLEALLAVSLCGVFKCVVQGGFILCVCNRNLTASPLILKLLSNYFFWCCLLIMLNKVVLLSESVIEILVWQS